MQVLQKNLKVQIYSANKLNQKSEFTPTSLEFTL